MTKNRIKQTKWNELKIKVELNLWYRGRKSIYTSTLSLSNHIL